MGVSIDHAKENKSGLSAEDLLFIAQNPTLLAEARADLVELRNLRAELVQRETAVEARERAADAKMVEAIRVKTEFEGHAGRLNAMLDGLSK
jgi:hypothetical protein